MGTLVGKPRLSRVRFWKVTVTLPDARSFTWCKVRGVEPWTAVHSIVRYGATAEDVPLRELVKNGYTVAVYPETEGEYEESQRPKIEAR